jgi:ribonuclease J
MKLIIHRGAKQIGGSCIEVSTERTRLILDVGAPLDDPAKLLERPKQKGERPKNIPNVPGLFDDGPRVDAVLLSHAHGDHTRLLSWVKPEIPVYLSKGTSKMLMTGSIFAGQPKLDRKRERILQPRKPTRIGDITVTGLPVDHSAFDGMALLIEAGGKRLLYSGDLRMHGRKPGMARGLFQFVAKKPVDVLLMEGTNLSREAQRSRWNGTEAELEEELFRAITCWYDLVLANFSPQHFDRMISFYKATRDAGRIFVLDVYGAFVWDIIRRQTFRNLMSEKRIRVYYNQSFQQSWRKHIPKLNDPFLKARVDLPAILADPDRYVMLFRPSMLKLDFGGKLPQHTLCLYSMWPGYLVKPEFKDLQTALEKAGGELQECHTSGHIFADDLVEFVKAINPRQVVPVHTETPEKFQELFQNALLLQDGCHFMV